MTQAEKLKAVLADRGMDEIALARMMRMSPGFMIGVTRGWALLNEGDQKWAEKLLGLEPGVLNDEPNGKSYGGDQVLPGAIEMCTECPYNEKTEEFDYTECRQELRKDTLNALWRLNKRGQVHGQSV